MCALLMKIMTPQLVFRLIKVILCRNRIWNDKCQGFWCWHPNGRSLNVLLLLQKKRVRKWAGEVPIKALLYSCPDKAGLEDRE